MKWLSCVFLPHSVDGHRCTRSFVSLEQWKFFKRWLIVWKGSLQLYVLKKFRLRIEKYISLLL